MQRNSTRVSPFLERLARESRTDGFDRSAAAMLAFDLYRRIHARGRFAASDSTELEAIRNRIVSRPPLASETLHLRIDNALKVILDSLSGWGDGRASAVAQQATYAAWLEYAETAISSSEWNVADAIFRKIGADAEIDSYIALAARARLREGYVARILGSLETAELLYARAWQLAKRARAYHTGYYARLGEVYLVANRGNVPAAEALLADVIRGVRRHAPSVLPMAYNARAGLFHRRGDVNQAVVWIGRALAAAEEPYARETIEVGVGSMLSEIRDPLCAAVARRALERVNALHSNASDRSLAAINLMSLAIETGDAEGFRRWRANLASVELHPKLAISYKLYCARGGRIFDNSTDVETLLDDAYALAIEGEFGQLQFQLDEERAAAAADGVPAPLPSSTLSSRARSALADLDVALAATV